MWWLIKEINRMLETLLANSDLASIFMNNDGVKLLLSMINLPCAPLHFRGMVDKM